MCTGAEIAGLVLAAGGAYMQQQSAEDAADKQRSIINQAAEQEAKLNEKKAQTIEGFADKTYNTESRDKSYEDAATKNEDSLVSSLLKANAANGGGEVSNATQGALSGDYTRARGAATAAATEDILKRAKLMARSNARGLMYNDETLKGGQLSSDIAGINADINSTNRVAQSRLGNVDTSGSLISGLMSGMSGAATGYLNGKQSDWEAALRAMGR